MNKKDLKIKDYKLTLVRGITTLTISPNPTSISDDETYTYREEVHIGEHKRIEATELSKTGLRNSIAIILGLPLLNYHEFISRTISYSNNSESETIEI